MKIKTKQNLRRLLMAVSPKEERESIVLEDNEELSQSIEMLAQSIGALYQKQERTEKDLVSFVENSIAKAQGHITDDVKGHKEAIDESFRKLKDSFSEYGKNTSSRTDDISKGLKKEMRDQIESLSEEISSLSKKMNGRPATWGGASIIQYLNGQTASPQNLYSNINWIFQGCSVTAVNNNQTQQVDVTITVTGGGGSGNSVYNEVVSGSDLDWVLADVPEPDTVRLYANGQRLTPTVDYSITDDAITTVNPWVSGTVLADYNLPV